MPLRDKPANLSFFLLRKTLTHLNYLNIKVRTTTRKPDPPTQPNGDFSCIGKPEGNYVSPYTCQQFYMCYEETTFLFVSDLTLNLSYVHFKMDDFNCRNALLDFIMTLVEIFVITPFCTRPPALALLANDALICFF